jgi:hypothetical protein
MRIRKISASIGLTINTGDYNAARLEMGADAEVGGEEGLTFEEAAPQHGKLTEYLRTLVGGEASKVKAMSREARRG